MRPARSVARAARAGQRALTAALGVGLILAGCRADPDPEPPPPTPAQVSAPASAPTPASAAPLPDAPSGDRWARPLPPEPDPAAKALYREALARLARGDHAGARPLIDRIRAEHPDSRFAARLEAAGGRAGGPLALLAALIALLAAAR